MKLAARCNLPHDAKRDPTTIWNCIEQECHCAHCNVTLLANRYTDNERIKSNIRKFVRVSPEVKATIRKTWQEGKMATSRAYYSCATCGIRDHGNYAQIDVAALPDFLHDGSTDVSGHYYAYLQLGHS